MIVNITSRTSRSDWQKDLELGMGFMGSYRMTHLRQDLMKSINELIDLVNQYHGVNAHRQDHSQCPEEFELGIKATHWEAGFPFQAYVGFKISEQNELIGLLHYTERATTDEFPLERSIQWKTEEFQQNPDDLCPLIVTWIKNYLIQYLSFQVIGRDVIYAVLEE
jgi:hypothetical protein